MAMLSDTSVGNNMISLKNFFDILLPWNETSYNILSFRDFDDVIELFIVLAFSCWRFRLCFYA
jgi:hypothetical protein